MIFRIAAAVLLFAAQNVSAQKLIIPESRNPAYREVRPLYVHDTVTIRFFGDIMMHTKQIETADRGDGRHDFSTYYSLMKEHMGNSDLIAGNMEFTLGGEPYTGYPSFSAPDSYADYLADCGFNLFFCANNHIFDKGQRGVRRTLDKYSGAGVHFTGAYCDEAQYRALNPLIINLNGIRVAFINATYGTNSPREEGWPNTDTLSDKDAVSSALDIAEAKSDMTIAFVHWGEEYTLNHSKEQEKYAIWLAENGADAIIGSHPHVIQETGTVKVGSQTVPVAYSLGNSVSNMSAANTQLGLMATLRIERRQNGDVRMLEPEYLYTWCSRPGGYGDSYYVIPLSDYADKAHEWKGRWDHEKMLATWRRVKDITGINENTK